MPSQNRNWADITDINERRRAQNRVAQRNYRTRQKLRTKLAEAVLFGMPRFHSAVASVGQKRKQGWMAAGIEDWADGSSTAPTDATTTEGDPRQSAATTLTGMTATGGCGPRGSRAREDPPPTTMAPCRLDSSDMPLDFGASSDLSLSAATERYCIDPALDRTDWIDIQCQSPSLMLLPTPPTQTGPSQPDGSVVVATSPEGQNGLASVRSMPLSPNSSRTKTKDTQTRGFQEPSPAFSLTSSSSSTQTSSSSPSSRSLLSSYSISSSSSLAPSPPKPLPTSANTSYLINPPSLCNHTRGLNTNPYTVPTTTSTLDFEPTSPLITAISLGNLQIAHLLIRSGAKIDIPDGNGKTALHLAVERGDIGIARALLDLGADVLTADSNGMRVLHTAVEKDNREMVGLVLGWCKGQSGNDGLVSSRSTDGHKEQAREERVDRGSNLVRRCINAQDGRKMTAVHLCVLLKRVEILKILLDYGADVNIGCT